MSQHSRSGEEFGKTHAADLDRLTMLVREHQAGLRAFIRALGLESDWVDDLAQEAFIVTYRKHAGFESGKDFGRWLRGIARNWVINERCKQARRARILNGALTDELLGAATPEEPSAPGIDGHVPGFLEECVQQLPERGRALLRRRYQPGENATTLAAAFDLSAEAVRQNLLRLRLTVKRCVEAKLGAADSDRHPNLSSSFNPSKSPRRRRRHTAPSDGYSAIAAVDVVVTHQGMVHPVEAGRHLADTIGWDQLHVNHHGSDCFPGHPGPGCFSVGLTNWARSWRCDLVTYCPSPGRSGR